MSVILPTLLLSGALVISAILPSWAAESWAVDPKTGAKIGWMSDAMTLVKATWSGGKLEGRANGKGILTITIRNKNGQGQDQQARADAEMAGGMLDGKVSIEWSDRQSYVGSYKAGLRDGHGVNRTAGGDVYDGEYKNGVQDGHGILKYANGNSFEGEFKNNQFSKGQYKWPNGQFYAGDFKNGLANAKGTMRYLNGATYEGDFVNDRPANGVLKDAQGAVMFVGGRKDLQDESMQQFGEAAAPLPASVPLVPAASRPTAPAMALAPPTLPAPAPRTQAPASEASVSADTALLRELRGRLYELNFDPAAADAPFVEADRRAIREFEEKNNLPQTGEATVVLLNNLRAAGGQSPWGAIVFAKSSGKWGMAWGHASRKEAVAGAVSSCGDARQCTVELSFFGTECGAFAYSGTTWALTARADADNAKEAALADCQKGGRSCRVVASVCAGGSDRSQAEKQE